MDYTKEIDNLRNMSDIELNNFVKEVHSMSQDYEKVHGELKQIKNENHQRITPKKKIPEELSEMLKEQISMQQLNKSFSNSKEEKRALSWFKKNLNLHKSGENETDYDCISDYLAGDCSSGTLKRIILREYKNDNTNTDKSISTEKETPQDQGQEEEVKPKTKKVAPLNIKSAPTSDNQELDFSRNRNETGQDYQNRVKKSYIENL